MIDVLEFLSRLSDASCNGSILVSSFVQICDDLRIGSETMGEIYLAIKRDELYEFIED